MITLYKMGNHTNSNVVTLYGLSTDTKPTVSYEGVGIPTGSSFLEVDTSTIFYYDEDSQGWIEGKGSSGDSEATTKILAEMAQETTSQKILDAVNKIHISSTVGSLENVSVFVCDFVEDEVTVTKGANDEIDHRIYS